MYTDTFCVLVYICSRGRKINIRRGGLQRMISPGTDKYYNKGYIKYINQWHREKGFLGLKPLTDPPPTLKKIQL